MQKPRARGGFNLLEVVFATFMFSFVAIVFTGVWGQHMRAMEKSRHFLVASHLAESLLERKIGAGYHVVRPGVEDLDLNMKTKIKSGVVNAVYHSTVTVTDIGGSEDNKRSVLVRVYWDENDTTKAGEVILETVLGSADPS